MLVAMATSKSERAAIAGLQELGFTGIEAKVYAALLVESPATAYRIAKRIGHPVANTYQAVATLRGRGAILVDDGESGLCRAVPPEELLAALQSEFLERQSATRKAMLALARDDEDDRVYRLATPDQVFERARALLRGRPKIVLGDLFPGVLAILSPALVAAARRGARVVVRCYGATPVRGIETVHARDGARALEAWPGQQLSLVVDAKAHVLALFSPDLASVFQAVASTSTFLSCMHHNHLANEIRLTGVTGTVHPVRTRSLDALALLAAEPPGLAALRTRFSPTRTRP